MGREKVTASGEHPPKCCTLPTALQAAAGAFENTQTVNPLSHIILIDCHFGNIFEPGSLHPTSSLQSHHKSSWAFPIFYIPSRFLGFAFIFISKTSPQRGLEFAAQKHGMHICTAMLTTFTRDCLWSLTQQTRWFSMWLLFIFLFLSCIGFERFYILLGFF